MGQYNTKHEDEDEDGDEDKDEDKDEDEGKYLYSGICEIKAP
jgi:hypothetical protein